MLNVIDDSFLSFFLYFYYLNFFPPFFVWQLHTGTWILMLRLCFRKGCIVFLSVIMEILVFFSDIVRGLLSMVLYIDLITYQ